MKVKEVKSAVDVDEAWDGETVIIHSSHGGTTVYPLNDASRRRICLEFADKSISVTTKECGERRMALKISGLRTATAKRKIKTL